MTLRPPKPSLIVDRQFYCTSRRKFCGCGLDREHTMFPFFFSGGRVAKQKQGYFRTSSQSIQYLAKKGKPELLIGFLVLARFSNGAPPDGIDPHTISCCGGNAMKTHAGLSEATARGVIDALQEEGIITPVTEKQKAVFQGGRFRPTYEIHQGVIDLDLPNAFVEGLTGAEVTPPLRRMRAASILSGYTQTLAGLSTAEIQLDALMLLLNIYRNTMMTQYGGLKPTGIYRGWETKSKRKRVEGYCEWMAEPDAESTERAYIPFMESSLPHIHLKKKGELSDIFKSRFWNAWGNIKSQGLVYEAITMYDTDPGKNDKARMICTLRVNDFHADSGRTGKVGKNIDASPDLSLFKAMENTASRALNFYTHPDYPHAHGEETEQLRLAWPDKNGHVIGIWRPRFRATNPDTGAWMDVEKDGINRVAAEILAA